jgi:hypothetical protein
MRALSLYAGITMLSCGLAIGSPDFLLCAAPAPKPRAPNLLFSARLVTPCASQFEGIVIGADPLSYRIYWTFEHTLSTRRAEMPSPAPSLPRKLAKSPEMI